MYSLLLQRAHTVAILELFAAGCLTKEKLILYTIISYTLMEDVLKRILLCYYIIYFFPKLLFKISFLIIIF